MSYGPRTATDGRSGWPLDVAARYLGQSVAATRKLYERRKVPHYQDGPGRRCGSAVWSLTRTWKKGGEPRGGNGV